ncbi:MAG: LuxR C-terminal-related transcriptional regulator [Deltaproteobacteria bacterium]
MKARELAPGIARSLSKRDLLQVVDAAYAAAPDEESWLRGVLAAAAPALDWGLGVCASTFSLREPMLSEKPILTGFVETGGGTELRAATQELHAQAPAAQLRSAYEGNLVSTLSDFLHCDLAGRPDVGPQLARLGARDVMGIVGFDPGGFGIVLSPLLPSMGSLPPAVRRAWLRVVTHLNAGLRLRASPDATPEAVLDLSGKVHDARGQALDKSARAALRQAARAIDRTRSRSVTCVEEALELRRAVVGGQWSLVDQFDADGRHFMVACRNPAGSSEPAVLSQREDQATALAAQGYSNKRIASVLGLSTGSVSTLLYRASRKWGAGSRTRLIQEWQKRQGPMAALEASRA